MITHRSMLRFSCRSGLLDRAVQVFGPRSETSSAADQSLKFLSQIPQVHGVRVTKVSNAGSVARDFLEGTHFVEAKCFSNREAIDLSIQVFGTTQEKKIFGTRELVSGLEGLKGSSYLHSNSEAVAKLNVVPQLLGNLVKKVHVSVCPTTLSLRSFIHSSSQKEFETTERNSRSMNFVRGIIDGDRRNDMGGSQFPQYGVEHNADIVHVKLMRNNTFVTVTDSKGNKKIGASSGMLSEMKGGPKLSRYAAEATAEHIGRLARNMGLKTFVVKVNGFTYFKKKRQAILSFREGYTHSRGDQNPIVYIEDTTRKAHNGCRLPKKRRV